MEILAVLLLVCGLPLFLILGLSALRNGWRDQRATLTGGAMHALDQILSAERKKAIEYRREIHTEEDSAARGKNPTAGLRRRRWRLKGPHRLRRSE